MRIKFVKMFDDVELPSYATPGAACFDIKAYMPELGRGSFYTSMVIDTGLKVEIPLNHTLLIFSRSGHGFKNDVRLANCVGVIDSDYRGELKVKLTLDDHYEFFTVEHGDRIAQGMIVATPQYIFEEVTELSSTERGTGGFGSTGN